MGQQPGVVAAPAVVGDDAGGGVRPPGCGGLSATWRLPDSSMGPAAAMVGLCFDVSLFASGPFRHLIHPLMVHVLVKPKGWPFPSRRPSLRDDFIARRLQSHPCLPSGGGVPSRAHPLLRQGGGGQIWPARVDLGIGGPKGGEGGAFLLVSLVLIAANLRWFGVGVLDVVVAALVVGAAMLVGGARCSGVD